MQVGRHRTRGDLGTERADFDQLGYEPVGVRRDFNLRNSSTLQLKDARAAEGELRRGLVYAQ